MKPIATYLFLLITCFCGCSKPVQLNKEKLVGFWQSNNTKHNIKITFQSDGMYKFTVSPLKGPIKNVSDMANFYPFIFFTTPKDGGWIIEENIIKLYGNNSTQKIYVKEFNKQQFLCKFERDNKILIFKRMTRE